MEQSPSWEASSHSASLQFVSYMKGETDGVCSTHGGNEKHV